MSWKIVSIIQVLGYLKGIKLILLPFVLMFNNWSNAFTKAVCSLSLYYIFKTNIKVLVIIRYVLFI